MLENSFGLITVERTVDLESNHLDLVSAVLLTYSVNMDKLPKLPITNVYRSSSA